jgi:hypothetical protein
MLAVHLVLYLGIVDEQLLVMCLNLSCWFWIMY